MIGQYGYTDEPGRWDHWPGAFQYTIPNEGFGDGVLIMDPGDIWYPAKRFLTTPVRMQFEKGAVVSIEGGYDAFMIKDYIEGWKDPEGLRSRIWAGVRIRARCGIRWRFRIHSTSLGRMAAPCMAPR